MVGVGAIVGLGLFCGNDAGAAVGVSVAAGAVIAGAMVGVYGTKLLFACTNSLASSTIITNEAINRVVIAEYSSRISPFV